MKVKQVSTTNIEMQMFNDRVADLTWNHSQYTFGEFHTTSKASISMDKDEIYITIKTKNSQYTYEVLKLENDNLKLLTYFGLKVYNARYIKYDDIKALPFYDFWLESAKGSGLPIENNETMVWLHDWEIFCEKFIKTGKHRFNK